MTYKMALGEDFSIVTKDGGTIVVPAIANSPLFDPLSAYSIGDKAYDGNDQYACISAVSAPASGQSNPMPSADPAHWELSLAKIAVDDYTKLQNMPQINGITLSGNKNAADLGLATKADATLTDANTWTFEPATFNGYPIEMREVEMYPSTRPGVYFFMPYARGSEIGVAYYDTITYATSLSLRWNGPDGDTPSSAIPLTATRASLSGYQLGSQSDKLCASEAEAEALRQGKQDTLTTQQLANIAAVPNKANESDLHYSFATKDLSNGIVTLDDRASNCTETSASTLSVAFPSQIDGKARNFAWILDATGQTAPSITFTDYIALLVDSSADLTPQLGTNMYKFAEISKNKFFASHRMLSTATANQPASTESLLAAMSAQGIDTSSITTPGDVTTALSIGQDVTFQDCINAAIY